MIESLETRRLLAADIVIDEFMADNVTGLRDEDASISDWIELTNRSAAPVDVGGWFLTNAIQDLDKWAFPAGVVINPGSSLVVFASGKDRQTAGLPLHTNFVLGAAGGYLGLVDSALTVVSEFTYPAQTPDVSYGLLRNVSDQVLVNNASPLRALTPTNNTLAQTWTGAAVNEPFNDSAAAGWKQGLGIAGYESPPTSGSFTVTTIAASVQIRSLGEADAILAGQRNVQSSVASHPTINFGTDSQLSHFGDDVAFGSGDFAPEDNFVVRAVGTVWVPFEQAGEWTFGIAADEGFRLRIDGVDLMKSEIFPFDDLQASIVLAAGPHTVELVYFEELGVAELELYAAKGHKGNFDSDFQLVGGNEPGALGTGGLTEYIGVDLRTAMFNINTSAYLRYAFTVADVAAIESLLLNITYNDGFVAYLNGQQVAAVNAPAAPTFNSTALAPRTLERQTIDISSFAGQLRAGDNILAIQGLKSAQADTRFYIAAELTARQLGAEQVATFSMPTPGVRNGSATPVISEIVSSNATTLEDDDGDTPDWLEIHNPGATDIQLGGWHLTDSATNLTQWTFPDVLLPAGGYLVVFASGKNRGGLGAPLHTNFQLDNAGEYLALVEPDGVTIVWQENLPGATTQRVDVSYGIDGALLAAGGSLTEAGQVYFTAPTPGAINGTGLAQVVGDPKLSVEHGFFSQPFSLAITSDTAGAAIRYTTDGTEPTLANGIDYTAPVALSSTATIRAAAFSAAGVSSEIVTQTYLFLADVLQQSPQGEAPAGFPNGPVNGQVLDYGMDPDIVNDPLWGPQLIDALQAIPTLSIVTDLDNLFDPEIGLYVNPEEKGLDWERPISVELINAVGDDGFQIDAGLRIRGQTSRLSVDPRHSLRVHFRDRYGDGDLNYPLFGPDGSDRFSGLDLRVDQLYSWSYAMYDLASYTRDVFSRDTQRDLGQPYAASRFYHLYINGQYWGVYEGQERIDADFAADKLGGDADDYDVVKAENGTFATSATDGNLIAWTALWQAATAGFATEAAFQKVQGRNPDGTPNAAFSNLVDVDSLIDYMLITFYGGNYDGPITASQSNLISKNWYGARNRVLNEGFRFFIYDAETTLLDPYLNHLGNYQAGGLSEYFNPQWLHQRLLTSANYRQKFIDRADELLGPNGLMSEEANVARLNARASELSQAMVAESARWGDAQRPNDPFTKANWQGAIDEINAAFFVTRGQLLKDALLPRGMGSTVAAPQFNQDGGIITPGFGLTADVVADSSLSESLLVSGGSTWQFLATGVDQGVAWRELDFDDSGWSQGNAQFGYGGFGEFTSVPFGPNPSDKYPTTYFRQTFGVDNASAFQKLRLQLYLGEGAVVYLNGQELARSSMPAGDVDFDTLASLQVYAPFAPYQDAIGGNLREFVVPNNLLVDGANVLAVEIHQEFRDSLEMIFDLALLGQTIVDPTVPRPAAIYYTTDGSDPRNATGSPSASAQRLDNTTTLVSRNSVARYRIPNGVGEALWQQTAFNDAAWTAGTAAIGYDTGALDTQPGFAVRTIDTSSGAIWDLDTAVNLLNGITAGFTVSSDTTTRMNSINFEDDQSVTAVPGTVDREQFAMRISASLVIPTGTWTLAFLLGLDGTFSLPGVNIVGQSQSGNYVFFVLQVSGAPVTSAFQLSLYETTLDDSFDIRIAPGSPTFFDPSFALLQNGQYGWGVTTTITGNSLFTSTIGTDVRAAMFPTRGSAYLRVPFQASNVNDIVGLSLSMQYDDGFVAYLNGTEVARRNAPSALTFNSLATSLRADANALTTTWIDLTAVKNLLVDGNNVLAIHGLNLAASNADFLIVPTLEAVYTPTPLPVTQSTLVRARARINGEWSPISEAQFTAAQPPQPGDFVVSELNYHPADPTAAELAVNPLWTEADFEFIELYNTTAHPLDLSGVQFSEGVTFVFATGVLLVPGQRLVLVRNPAAFAERYGAGVQLAGTFAGTLSNNGEQLTLLAFNGDILQRFAYDDTPPWPTRADGLGATLEVVSTTGDYANSDNWNSSDEYGGSPGTLGIGPIDDVVVNEVFSHSVLPLVDTIELHNVTAADIDIGGWYLSDSNDNFKKYRIPDGTVIPAGGYITFDESDFNPTPATPGPNDFSLNGAHGDQVWLLSADGAGKLLRFVDDVSFGAAGADETWGRWPNATGDLYPMASPTLGAVNSGPRIGPVVLSEIMYNPSATLADDDLEYIELANVGNADVDISGWKFDAGVTFTFANGTVIPAHGTLVVTRFNPLDPLAASKLAAFEAAYGAGLPLVGGYAGVLDNGGETVRLVRPDAPPLDEPNFTPYLLVDEVRYDDIAPWPASADGSGLSLSRASAVQYARESGNWFAAAANPGLFAPGVVQRYVFYNNSSFDGNDAATGAADDAAIASGKTPLLPGGTASFANYSNYSRGINGIMIDVAGLPGTPTAADFTFRIGNDNNPALWVDAPAPDSIVVRSGAGAGASNRIELTWADGAIKNTWLQVTLKATAATGLTQPDVFYFGNAVGETGDSAVSAVVNSTDEIAARNNPRTFLNKATVDSAYDFNRDGLVNATDQIIARSSATTLATALNLISVPASVQAAAGLASAALLDESLASYGADLVDAQDEWTAQAEVVHTGAQVTPLHENVAIHDLTLARIYAKPNLYDRLVTASSPRPGADLDAELFELVASELAKRRR